MHLRVEAVRTETIQHFRKAGDHERDARLVGEVVGEGWETLDVVEVGMAQSSGLASYNSASDARSFLGERPDLSRSGFRTQVL